MKILNFNGIINVFRTFKDQDVVLVTDTYIDYAIDACVACSSGNSIDVLSGTINVNSIPCGALGLRTTNNVAVLGFVYDLEAYKLIVKLDSPNDNAILLRACDEVTYNNLINFGGIGLVDVITTEKNMEYSIQLTDKGVSLIKQNPPGLAEEAYSLIKSENIYKTLNEGSEGAKLLANKKFDIYSKESSVREIFPLYQSLKNIVSDASLYGMQTYGEPMSARKPDAGFANELFNIVEKHNPKFKMLYNEDQMKLHKTILYLLALSSVKNGGNFALEFCNALIKERPIADICADNPVFVYSNALIYEEDDFNKANWLIKTFKKLESQNADIKKEEQLFSVVKEQGLEDKYQSYKELYSVYIQLKRNRKLDDNALVAEIEGFLNRFKDSLDFGAKTNENFVI